jgi:hypothetical protein
VLLAVAVFAAIGGWRPRRDAALSRSTRACWIDADSSAATAFAAHGTPMGVPVEDGKIASGVTAGADAGLALVRGG